jgi:hypothetical protein
MAAYLIKVELAFAVQGKPPKNECVAPTVTTVLLSVSSQSL